MLGRRVGDSIVIDESIEVTVLRVNEYGQVRIGITAPDEVPIRRAELPERSLPRIRSGSQASEPPAERKATVPR